MLQRAVSICTMSAFLGDHISGCIHSAGVFTLAQLHSMLSPFALTCLLHAWCQIKIMPKMQNKLLILHSPPHCWTSAALWNPTHSLSEIGDDLCSLIGWLTGMPLLPTGDFILLFFLTYSSSCWTCSAPLVFSREGFFLFCRVCSMNVSFLVEHRMNKT